MGLRDRVRGRWTAIASSSVLAITSGALIAVAATSPGYPATDLSLHDGGVWVTGVSRGVLGQVGPEIRQQIMALPAFGSSAFDVLQDGGRVLLRDDDGRVLRRVDVPGRRFAGPGAALPPSAQVAMGGDTVAVLDPATGALWVRPVDEAANAPYVGAPPTVTLGARSAVAVDATGIVHGVAPATSDLVRIEPGGAAGASPRRTKLEGLSPSSQVAVTTVGDTPVVLVDRRTVLVPGGRPVPLPAGAADGVLQQPSATQDAVLVQTRQSLFAVPLDGSAVRTLTSQGSGAPAEPVRLGGCSYAVWSGTPRVAAGCGQDQLSVRAVGAAPGSRLMLRVNRSRVVLNDPRTGDAFLPDDPRVSIAQWERVGESTKNPETSSEQQTSEQVQFADRKGANRPPQPQPDVFGVRPGSTVVLPVLDNDADPDGDVLTVRPPAGGPPTGFGRVQVVAAGRALQFTAGAQPGSQSIEYAADDGRVDGVATSTAKVIIVPRATNTAPRRTGSAPVVPVGRAGRISYDVLRDWRDPEGDPLTLTCPGARDESVRCSPDGTLTYTDSGRRLGQITIPVRVGDGRATAEGSVVVDVVTDRGPLVRPDFAVGIAGVPIVLRPLLNDTSYTSVPLQLTRVTPSDVTASATLKPDGTVALRPSREGTVYLTYQVAAGEAAGTGLIRVDVASARGARPPVAAPDSAVVRPLAPRVLDVLANDTDADGDVLVLTGASAPPGTSGLTAEVLGHRTIRVTAAAGFTGPATVSYTVSDGGAEATGALLVRRAPDDLSDASPVAVDDVGTVRAGQIITVPVLGNDSDPEGEPLRLDADLRNVSFRPADPARTATVLGFTSGDVVRVVAPDAPGTVTLTYTARDAQGQPGSATLTVRVTPAEGPNTAPAPVPLEARAISGRVTSIVVPLVGLDPDGDPVRLAAPARQPKLGALELDPTRSDALRYTARPDAHGADQVSYEVADAFGATGVAMIRIGVAPPPTMAVPPVAVADDVVVRNDRARRVQVAVLANDTSGDGSPVTLAGTDPLTPLSAGAQLRLVGSTVEVGVPQGATSPVLGSYRVESGGLAATTPGLLTVTPRADAPLQAPSARDDVAPSVQGSSSVDVQVLRNDSDPDGTPADLRLARAAGAVGPAGLAVRADDRTLRVTPGRNDRWAWYTVEDGDGLTARALVFVRGTDAPPRLKAGAPPFTVQDGQTKTLALADYVESPGGRRVQLTDPTRISGSGVTVRAVSATSVAVTGATVFGPGAVTFEVMDGSSATAPGVHRVFLTVPVTVTSKGNRVPSMRPLAVTVARDETAGAAVDLEAATVDDPADAGRHTYRVVRVTGGVAATVEKSRLTVKAGSGRAGATGEVVLEVSDGRLKGPGTVAVTVTDSTKPPPQAADCSPPSPLVDPGSSFSIDVGRCVANPGGGTITVSVTGSAAAAATVSGRTVTVNVPPSARGAIDVPYTVKDSTGRTASARIVARAVGRPTAPGAPQVAGNAGGALVVLRWTAADAQGGTISEYRVRSGGFSKTCPGDATQCEITGLDPASTYTFTVSAVNERGEGPTSPPSAAVRADSPPDPPSAVTARPGDGSATVTWTGSNGGGSPITSYTVGISPATADGRSSVSLAGAAGSMSTTIGGLTNGTAYAFSVKAKNNSQVGFSQSTSSASVIPAGPARTPPTPGATIGAGRATITWSGAQVLAAANGQLARLVINDGADQHDVTGSAAGGSATIPLPTALAVEGVTYGFSLTVTNNLGSSATSGTVRAQAVRAPAKPVVSEPAASEYLYNGAIAANVALGDSGGAALSTLVVRWAEGSVSATPPADGNTTITMRLSPLVNGVKYTFVAEVCNAAGLCSSSDPVVAGPRAAPELPEISIAAAGTNRLLVTWTAGPNANGTSPTTGVYVWPMTGGTQPVQSCDATYSSAGSCTVTGVPGNTYQAVYTVTAAPFGGREVRSTPVTLPVAGPTPSIAVSSVPVITLTPNG